QPLLQRVGSNQPLEFADQLAVTSKSQLRLDPILEYRQPRRLQLRDRSLRKRLIAELRERFTPPQPERRSKPLPGARGIAGSKRPSPLRTESANPALIDLLGFHGQPVAPALGHDDPTAEHLTKVRDVHLHRLGCRSRRLFAPKLVDQSVSRNHLAPVE